MTRLDRSRPLSGGRRWLTLLPLGFFAGYVLWVDLSWAKQGVGFLLPFYSVFSALTLLILVSGVFWRSFAHLPPAPGRVLAIVPVYNEDPELVRAAVLSLTRQTRLPQAIHVIDDGSDHPLEEFDHPLVTWHHTKNQGKRHAQAHALRLFSPNRWDYILTVDSDSVCDPDALEHLLRSMSNPEVQASTGMIFVRNWKTNFLTRLTDINVVSSCLMFRQIRSWLGIVSPTSGALALYRSGILYDNLEDYVSSGTAGDDRRLSFYALLKGKVVGVHEAVVETALPDRWRDVFHQRLRWSKSAWLGIPFVLTNMNPLVIFSYMYPIVFALLWPLAVTVLSILFAAHGSPALLYGALFWQVVAVAMTGVYALYRPDFTWKQRLAQFLLAPVYPILGLVILRPASYWALTKLKSNSWHTRKSVVVEDEESPELVDELLGSSED